MPVLNRRHQVLGTRYGASALTSPESYEGLKEQLWIVDEDYEKSQKEMDFPSAKLASRQKSRNKLRINTYSKQELHDRYLSSEEEPSPSPDDYGQKYEEALKEKPSDIFMDDNDDDDDDEELDQAAFEEIKAEIAIAVQILACGRPKLIDITNLAPMHKRKRLAKPSYPHSAAKHQVTSRTAPAALAFSSPALDENRPQPGQQSQQSEGTTEPATPPRTLVPPTPAPSNRQLKRKESFSIPAPESWLPEADDEDDEEPKYRIPTVTSRHRKHTYNRSIHDFAFAPDPPRLPKHHKNRSQTHFSTRIIHETGPDGNFNYAAFIAPPRTHSPTTTPMTITGSGVTSWKGLTRSLSLAKRQSGSQPVSTSNNTQSESKTKKPKMVPRGANEREELITIPPFPFEERSVAVPVS